MRNLSIKMVVVLAVGVPCGMMERAEAGVVYGTSGFEYSQDFNTTLASSGTPAWANDTTVPGWWYVIANGTTPSTYAIANGSGGVQNQILSVGATGQSDRALGGQSADGASSGQLRYGVQFSNATGMPLSEFTLTYKGEQWRVSPGSENISDSLTVQYQLFASGTTNQLTTSTGWTTVPSLTFVPPDLATSGTKDGNVTGGTLSATVTGFSWAPGMDLWIRWVDEAGVSGTNRRVMMAVDDVKFTAVPEPASIGVITVAAMGLLIRRGRNWSRPIG